MNHTPLFEEQVRLGGRMVEFAGFMMPVQFSGLVDEHMAVRTAAGVFDVSHMGEVEVKGPEAFEFVQSITTNDVSKLSVGRAHYTSMLTERGTFVDDLLVYMLAEDHFFLVINAANAPKDIQWMRDHNPMGAVIEDRCAAYAQIAVQGPNTEAILQPMVEADLPAVKYYRFTIAKVIGREAIVSRTGYTGEDGFEIYCSPEDAAPIYRELFTHGKSQGLKPCGLGARDTLRLEACMALYGNDIDDAHTPWEAGLDWIVKIDKGDFIGRPALQEQKETGITRKLVGFEMIDKGIARHGYPVVIGDEVTGEVTSGTQLPFVGKAMGMAYVPVAHTEPGTEILIDIRGRRLKARVVPMPFYKRQKS
ncbi:MAG TPA: glycine cleavage system aminomethyltransferase GcvT [Thermoanaerobaculia bacterium]|nr:glycine cleavage system aminomethyltransferase GcvT [Thermoanaerobaculia bacterium]HUM30187.1 glycine cleavage system aminomethyltransferase GcvT [Thermoanaerobaculia bacterium]HXK68364.1 glycine cleavage system aminomethyltransferase GcvT [Thermoanaerobaculia bacterium]